MRKPKLREISNKFKVTNYEVAGIEFKSRFFKHGCVCLAISQWTQVAFSFGLSCTVLLQTAMHGDLIKALLSSCGDMCPGAESLVCIVISYMWCLEDLPWQFLSQWHHLTLLALGPGLPASASTCLEGCLSSAVLMGVRWCLTKAWICIFSDD